MSTDPCMTQEVASHMSPEEAALMEDTLSKLLEQWHSHEHGIVGAAREVVDLLDVSCQGGIDEEQFLEFIESLSSGDDDDDEVDDEEFTFSSFDKDGDGKLSRAELADMLRDMTGDEPTDKDVDDILAEFDADGDGMLDVKEFLNMLA